MPSGKIVTATAFAPAHITGFFQIHEDADLMKKGSTGCGVVLDRGVRTTVKAGGNIKDTLVFLNCREVPGDTIRSVVQKITADPARIDCISDIPVGCGFGASGAGALGTAYALNHALSLDLTASQLNDIAHMAEVSNRSGLGDVTGQAHGGILIRKTPGAPSIATVDSIPCSENDVYCVVLGELSTKSVISDPEMVQGINEAGKIAMKRLMQSPSADNFMLCSREFTIQSRLASEKVEEAIEAARTIDVVASQAMLGNTVFSMPPSSAASELEEILGDFGEVLKFRIRTGSIRIA
ncbi:pantoate kinase [Methanolobus sp. WCC5]|jgi:pantoate kinase|uniref:pantoate kinase n=1 Tax=Methanolobus sp. WCC5 TaxID=3125785 RepID=UPI003251E12B